MYFNTLSKNSVTYNLVDGENNILHFYFDADSSIDIIMTAALVGFYKLP
jgi:hypothetical protein